MPTNSESKYRQVFYTDPVTKETVDTVTDDGITALVVTDLSTTKLPFWFTESQRLQHQGR